MSPRASAYTKPCGRPEIPAPGAPATRTRSTWVPGPIAFSRKARVFEPRNWVTRTRGGPAYTSETRPPGGEPATKIRGAACRRRGTSTRKRTAERAAASVAGRPSPGRPGGPERCGGVGTRRTSTLRRPSQSSTAWRASGTAAIAAAGTANAQASATARPRRDRRPPRRFRGRPRVGTAAASTRVRTVLARAAGVGGNSASMASARRRVSRSGIVLLQSGAEPIERAGEAGLHRAGATAEDGGHLRLAQVEEVAQIDRLPVAVAQSAERGAQGRVALGHHDYGLGGRRRDGARRVLRRAQLPARPPPRGTAPVARLVGDDPQQPRPPRRADPEAPEGAVRLDERVLRRLLGVRGAAGDHARRAKRHVGVTRDELLVRGDITAQGTHDELGVLVHRRAVHRPPRSRSYRCRRTSHRPPVASTPTIASESASSGSTSRPLSARAGTTGATTSGGSAPLTSVRVALNGSRAAGSARRPRV